MSAASRKHDAPATPAGSASATSSDVHDFVRAVLRERRGTIERAGLKVAIELNARETRIEGFSQLQTEVVAALERAIASTSRGAEIVVRTSTRNRVGLAVTVRIHQPNETPSTEPPIGEEPRGCLFEGAYEPAPKEEHLSGTLRISREARKNSHREVPSVGRGATVSEGRGLARANRGLAANLGILVVEDDPDAAALLERGLTRRGHDVRVARSLQEALLAAGERKYDLLISDLNLPDGTGTELVGRIDRPERAIAITGAGGDADVASLLSAGFQKVLLKPVVVPTIEAAISELFADD